MVIFTFITFFFTVRIHFLDNSSKVFLVGADCLQGHERRAVQFLAFRATERCEGTKAFVFRHWCVCMVSVLRVHKSVSVLWDGLKSQLTRGLCSNRIQPLMSSMSDPVGKV